MTVLRFFVNSFFILWSFAIVFKITKIHLATEMVEPYRLIVLAIASIALVSFYKWNKPELKKSLQKF